MFRRWLGGAFALVGVWSASAVAADQVILTNEDKLTGTVEQLVGGKLTFKSSLAGVVTIPLESVQSLATDNPVRVVLTGDRKATAKLLLAPGKKVGLEITPGQPPQEFNLSEVTAINPPIPKEPRWEGNATLGLNIIQAASNTQNFNLFAGIGRTRAKDSTAFDFTFLNSRQRARGAANDTTTEETWILNGNHSYSIGHRLNGYFNGRLQSDRIQNLDLRSILGAGIGYEVLKRPNLALSVNAGLAWVRDDFNNAADRNTFNGQFGYLLTSNLTNSTRLRHTFSYLPNLSNLNDNYLVAQFGLEQSLSGSLYFDIRAIIEHDTTPAPAAPRTTSRYVFGIGKRF